MSSLASQCMAARARFANTSVFMERMARRRASFKLSGAPKPRVKYSRRESGGRNRKNSGRASSLGNGPHFRTGFEMNPAQRMTPVRFGGCVAANFTATVDPYDSPKIANGTSLGTSSVTQEMSSGYGRNRSRGYAAVITFRVRGNSGIRGAKRFPVPSNPGRRTRVRGLRFVSLATVG
jgi:hypothetical protein